METYKFHSDAPNLNYYQKSLKSCCFSSLASAFDSINQNKSADAISLRIEESLESEVGNCIVFANDILKNETKGEPKVYHSPVKYKKKGYGDILKDISKIFALAQFVDHLGNLNHAISVVGYWIFDSNYKKALVIIR